LSAKYKKLFIIKISPLKLTLKPVFLLFGLNKLGLFGRICLRKAEAANKLNYQVLPEYCIFTGIKSWFGNGGLGN